jgi:archaellum biogenesis ATPase FlaH
MEQMKILNYVAIEERQNCGIFNAQLTLRDFISQMKSSDTEMQQKSEKLLYLFLQAIDMTK